MVDRKLFLIAFFSIASLSIRGQAIDNTASFRAIDSDHYIRLTYDNDYFTATDYYYTQGINLEIVAPSYKNFLLSKALFASSSSLNQFGISIEHNGYTPTSIEHDEILYGDRPFAAAIMLKTFSMSTDTIRHRRITSSLSLGVIGPAAGGYGMQKSIHEWIGATTPHGWQNQIQNDVIINYEVGTEKNFVHVHNHFVLNGMVNARVGTLNTKLTTGFVLMFGRLNPAITRAFSEHNESTKKLRFHIYMQPLVNVVGYDASLQGGLFNKNSPYTISPGDISRITLQGNYGFVFSFNAVQLEYFKSIITKEFDSGLYHRWGGIRVGVKF